MANEIQLIHDDGAETVYAIVRDMAGQWYAGATPETFAVANWATYDIALSEVSAASSGNVAVQGTFPAVAAGFYWLDVYVQAGANPAQTDFRVCSCLMYWNGTTLVPAGGCVTYVNSAPPTPAAIATAVWQDTTAGDFNVSGSIGKSLFTSGVVPGGAGGLFIAGTNAQTTITTSLITGAITLTTPVQANLAGIKTTALPAEAVAGQDAAGFAKFFDVTTPVGTVNLIQSDLIYIHGSALTETSAGYLSAGFKKFFDVATPVFTCASVNQTGDSYAIVNGAHGLVSIQDDIDAVLEDTGTTIPATLTSMSGATFNTSTDSLEAIRNRGDAAWLSQVGAGAITFTYTVTDAATGSPIDAVEVWATSDIGGSTLVASGTTNGLGQVVFYLDAGTYYIWRSKAGWNFTNPDTEVVS